MSQLIAAGRDVLTISRRIGHASPSITLDVYGHMFKNTDTKAAEIIETAFGAWARNENGDGVARVAIGWQFRFRRARNAEKPR